MSDNVRLVPSVKVTRKESKVTRGVGADKVTEFVACWDYELFYPLDEHQNIPDTLKWCNQTIIEARKHAKEEEQ